ncbi:hypothetical protein [Ochrobactrum chromiisoli]|uniref:Uncharacterized protein n=1 Tax=Ochrobactrum chromiisoli TaxID=2993941 RepID=A0ABT3QS54_9HYPH|nr:hypothetical protein [Ochrobactrum chromiisoli]MCX2698458.1 hypothetical protein [Ochrobactrum chromiisoli]
MSIKFQPITQLPVLAVAVFALAGCQNTPDRDPLPYSPNYHMSAGQGGNVVRKGYDKQATAQGRLVPDACVTPDVVEDPLYLPPGCANNLNLQMMVERQSDLVHGRTTGPAMAAPVVRAARRVIDGEPPKDDSSAKESLNTTGSLD